MTNKPEELTGKESLVGYGSVALVLHSSISFARKIIKQEKIPFKKVGRKIYFRSIDIYELILPSNTKRK
jgi:hypothetical protein